MDWCSHDACDAVQTLRSDEASGLSSGEAQERLRESGRNELEGMETTSWSTVFLRQFTDLLILILFFAALLSLVVGEWIDAVAIVLIIVLNGLLGFVQEWKAERSLEALRKLLSPVCTVIRDGRQQVIEATELVVGDVVLLEVGKRVPADLRILSATNLLVDQSTLTGEASSVAKSPEPVFGESPAAEKSSCLWLGTVVTHGHAKGIVIATGMDTEFGKVARLTSGLEREQTPLQRALDRLAKRLAVGALILSLVIGLLGFFTGKELFQMVMAAIALAVAVVPEGLPAVVTVTLALGIRNLVRKRALVRRLQAAETLGAVSVICTDKTGTLTRNEMTVQRIWLRSKEFTISGVGYEPQGVFLVAGKQVEPERCHDLQSLLYTALRCNRASLQKGEGGWEAIGEPTEAALVVAAKKANVALLECGEVLAEFSFSSSRKRMTVIEQCDDTTIAHVKGAPDGILSLCGYELRQGKKVPLSESSRWEIQKAYERLEAQGLRALAFAKREVSPQLPLKESTIETQLIFLGLVGILDPPRVEVPQAIKQARRAGIQIRVVTGDSARTAKTIAEQIGLPVEQTVEGSEFDHLSDSELITLLQKDVLFARTTPLHKLRLVELLQAQGEVVAMTGDGVNDAPALKRADVGVAMGIRGTDVAKGAADIILTDDNFASIVSAVEEGRRQYDNIQKFVHYLLSSNLGEVVAIAANIMIGGPLILLPVQILWMNLVTDGLTAVALGLEPAEKENMTEPPRNPNTQIVSREYGGMLLVLGVYIGMASLGVFYLSWNILAPGDVMVANTLAFTSMVVLEKFNVFNFRTLRASLLRVSFFSNRWLLAAWGLSLSLQVAAVHLPLLQKGLGTVALDWQNWGLVFTVSLTCLFVGEVYKYLRADVIGPRSSRFHNESGGFRRTSDSKSSGFS